MQQPSAQNMFAPHSLDWLHGSSPDGHVVVPLQVGGRSLGPCPGHSVQPPHGLSHAVVLVQRGHALGSLIVASVQLGDTAGWM